MKRSVIGLFARVQISQEGNTGKIYIFQHFLAQLYHWVNTVNNMRHQGATNNMLALKLLSNARSRFTFTFEIARTLFILWSNSTYRTFHKIRCLSVVLGICKSFIIISPYSVYVVNLMYCNRLQLTMSL